MPHMRTIKSFRFALAPLALLALSACATSAPATGPRALASEDGPSSIYGLYLAGQTALISGDSQMAADYFARARASSPDAAFLKERVFTAALLSGDIPRAAQMAPGPAEGSPSSQSLGILTQAVEDLANDRGKEAYAKLAAPHPDLPVAPPTTLLKPWAAAAAGDWVEALTLPDAPDRLTGLIASLDQALLFERAKRYPEAETAYKALLSDTIGHALIGPEFGVFLERRGRRQEAIAIYDQLLAAEPDNAGVLAAKARAARNGAPPPQMTIREGAAQALMAPAAAVLTDKQSEGGLVYLRLILRLDPKLDDAWLMAGDVIGAAGDVRSSRAAYEQVAPKSAHYADARSRLAWSYQPDDKPAALKSARDAVASAPDNDAAQITLADLLRADNQFEEAAKVLDGVIGTGRHEDDWRLYYARAVALERAGRWPDAVRDLNKALAIKPDQPEVLNYLGYSWVNRGEKTKEGMDMIRRAVDAQPDEGAYVDSLGWAYYRTGDFANAVTTLERAVMLDAGDAEINDHLGDAYWRAGRRDEARFQWRAVLVFNPDPEVKARAEIKLASPLGADAVVKAPTVASQ